MRLYHGKKLQPGHGMVDRGVNSQESGPTSMPEMRGRCTLTVLRLWRSEEADGNRAIHTAFNAVPNVRDG